MILPESSLQKLLAAYLRGARITSLDLSPCSCGYVWGSCVLQGKTNERDAPKLVLTV
jgi:hypothetical protein